VVSKVDSLFDIHNQLDDEISLLTDDQDIPRPSGDRILHLNNVKLLALADQFRSVYTRLVGTKTLGKPNKPLKV